MPVQPTFPGVYIEEIPSGVRPITGVATSIAAFIDYFIRGPLDLPYRILSIADFQRTFGGLDVLSEASYAINQFFLSGGSEAYVVRVTPAGDAAAAATILVTGSGVDIFNATAGRRLRGESVFDPGEWGNFLRLEVDYDTVQPNELIDPLGVQTPGELFNLSVSEVTLRDGRTLTLQTERFANLTMRPGARNLATEVVNDGSKLVQLDRNGLGALADPPERPQSTGTQGDVLAAPFPITDGSVLNVDVDPDGPLGPLPVISRPATIAYQGAPVPTTAAAFRPFLEAAIRAAEPANPLFSGATVRLENNRFRVLLGRNAVGFRPDAQVTFQNGATADALGLSALGGGVVSDQQLVLTGGDDGGLPDAAALRGVRAAKTGMYALEDADLFNILCIPRAAALAAVAMQQVYQEAEAYCEERRSFLIVDVPEGTDFDDVQTWLDDNAGLRHRNAAVYFPRVRVADPLNGNRLRSLAPSGTMAGLYARTDGERGVWKAPAGTEVRLRVNELDEVLTDPQNGVLNPLGVNCLRNFPVFGNISWGARTLDGADQIGSEWKYIPVRRLALYLEESLFRGTKWVVFEPNDEPLWSQIRLNVGAFMQRLFRQGAFQGRTPREAYLVKCDAETTTQADIDLGIVNIVVGFAPLKPAEFVILRIQQLAGQIPT